MSTSTNPVLVRSTEAEVLAASGVTLLADTPATNGHLTSHRSIFKPGKEGAPRTCTGTRPSCSTSSPAASACSPATIS